MDKRRVITWEGVPFWVYYPGDSVEETRKIFELGNVKGLRIIAKEVPFQLDFLKDFDFIKILHVGSIGVSYDYKFDFLPFLPNLEELIINLFTNSLLDLSLAPPIKKLYLQWRKKKVKGLDKCVNLRDICVSDYKEPDFEQFQPLKKLKRITVKSGSIKSLDGLEGCENLEILSLGGCRYLTDISKLVELPSLKSVHIERCSQVHDFSVLAKLPNLERLWIEDCKNIESIGFLRDMPQLRELSIMVNSVILDNDLSPALSIPHARIAQRESYNMVVWTERRGEAGGFTYGWWYSVPIDLGD